MKYLKEHMRDFALVALLLIVSLTTRTVGLGVFLTADEKTWIGRSHEFIRAFKDVRFNDMLQTTHPGVTTLWAAGTTITAKMIGSGIPFTNATLFHFIKSSQFSIAFLNALAVPCIYLLLLRLFVRRDLAFYSALFIALDPFIIGYSRVIHVDALLGSFLTLAVIASIVYAKTLTRTWLIASATLSALALLTKFPAVFLFPFIICALVVWNGKSVFSYNFLLNRFRDALTWILIVVLLIFIIWPALLWVPNPVGNVLQLKRDISVAAVTPHNMTEDYSLNAFHYPAALLSRSNPVSLIGGILGLLAIGVSLTRKKIDPEIFLIALYVFGFVVMMTLGAKKGDRYIIPVFFALDIVAAYGIVWLCGLLRDLNIRRLVTLASPLFASVYLVIVIISYHPYAVAYSNPLFPDNISQELGWGEGLDQVASWLNTNFPNATVASWYPGELGPFTSATVLHINAHEQNQVQFIVLYRNMFGREPSHYANDFIDEYFKKREPVFVAQVAGKEFAWVYEKPSYGKTVGDLDDTLVVVQEAVAEHNKLAGIRILPATRFGEASTGDLIVDISRGLLDEPIYSETIALRELKDGFWYLVDFPQNVAIEKGEHFFVSMRVVRAQAPYASLRYTPDSNRGTPIYISRTGSVEQASAKPGSLGVQLMYVGNDGKLVSELETKLLQ